MVYIVLAVIFMFLGFIFLISAKFSKNSEAQFKNNAFITTGTVVSRKLNSDGYMSEYYINVVDQNGNEKEMLSQSFKESNGDIKPGTQIKVAIAEKKTLGISTYELRVVDERYAKVSSGEISVVLTVISVIMFVVAACMLVFKLLS